MFFQDKDSQFLEQKKTRPKIENIAAEYSFTHNGAEEALRDFITWLKAKKILIGWASSNAWSISYKGRRIGTVRFCEGSLYIDPPFDSKDSDLASYLNNEKMAEIIWANIEFCVNCCSCSPGRSVKILGKDFTNVCHSVRFKDPNTAELACAKKLFEYNINIPHGTASKPVFDTGTDALVRIDSNRISGVKDLRGISVENAEKLFDGSYSSVFYNGPYGPYKSDGRSCDILFQLDEPVTVKMYSLVTYKEDNVPINWILYGADSNDGPWTQLDARKKSDAFPGIILYYTEKAFKISCVGNYKYYKLTFEGRAYQLTQIHLYL